MFRGAAVAGLSIALCLVATPALAGTVTPAGAVAPAPTTKTSPGTSSKTSTHKSSHPSSGSGGSSAGVSNGPLPNATQQCPPTGSDGATAAPSGTPWAQQVLDYSSVWQYAEGKGVTVAVIDSGVDANPQYADRVSEGQDLVSGTNDEDCVGHGTMVAGIIAAAPRSGTPFAGIAPEAHILSVKVAGNSDSVDSNTLAQAIIDAVQDGAQILNISIDTTGNDPYLQDAVNYALDHNVVVVAAAGNDQQSTNANGTTTTTHGPFYPADYPGVLSVGAMDTNGDLANFSDTKTTVSVTAPGVSITSTYPGANGLSYAANQGTSFAAPFVSGLAALIISRYPGIKATQVAQLITETADGSTGLGTGNGLINPVQAITAVLPSGPAPTVSAKPGAVTVDRATPNRSERTVALSLAGGAFGAAVLVIAAALVIPAGRRRRWRPGGHSSSSRVEPSP